MENNSLTIKVQDLFSLINVQKIKSFICNLEALDNYDKVDITLYDFCTNYNLKEESQYIILHFENCEYKIPYDTEGVLLDFNTVEFSQQEVTIKVSFNILSAIIYCSNKKTAPQSIKDFAKKINQISYKKPNLDEIEELGF